MAPCTCMFGIGMLFCRSSFQLSHSMQHDVFAPSDDWESLLHESVAVAEAAFRTGSNNGVEVSAQ